MTELKKEQKGLSVKAKLTFTEGVSGFDIDSDISFTDISLEELAELTIGLVLAVAEGVEGDLKDPFLTVTSKGLQYCVENKLYQK